MYSASCQSCGKTFEARRFGVKTCSDRCRKRLSRGVSSGGDAPVMTVAPSVSGEHADPVTGVGTTVLSVTEAVRSGSTVDQLRAIRSVLAKALDAESTPASALPALSRQLSEVTRELASVMVREESETPLAQLLRERSERDLRDPADTDWNPEAI